MKEAPIITEDTKFNLKFNNIWALIAMTAMLVLTFGAIDKRITRLEDKMDMLIVLQKDTTLEFRDWKRQEEGRLGITQSNQRSIMSFLKREFKFEVSTN